MESFWVTNMGLSAYLNENNHTDKVGKQVKNDHNVWGKKLVKLCLKSYLEPGAFSRILLVMTHGTKDLFVPPWHKAHGS